MCCVCSAFDLLHTTMAGGAAAGIVENPEKISGQYGDFWGLVGDRRAGGWSGSQGNYSAAEWPIRPFSTAQAAIWDRAAKPSVARILVT